MVDLDALRTRWNRALEGARPPGAGPDPAPYADNLLARWQEPQRHYHTLAHLTAVLEHIDVLEKYAADPDVVRLAAWFHDAVYLPERSENEERSARLAERALLEAGVSEARTAQVARLVRLTVTHAPADDDRDGQVLCDADLAILASPPPRTPPTRPPCARSTTSCPEPPSARDAPRCCANSSICHTCSGRRTDRRSGRRRRATT